MMRKRGMLVLAVLIGGVSLSAFGITIELEAGTVAMANVNALIDDFNEADVPELAHLNVGVGLGGAIPVYRFANFGILSVGARGTIARQSARDASIVATSLGLLARFDAAFGRWTGSGEFYAGRGQLDFAAERLAGLTGWGLGLGGSISYGFPVMKRLSATAAVGFRWHPISEMSDDSGQKYRGRGTPFVDFSGLSASIGMKWMVSERSDE